MLSSTATTTKNILITGCSKGIGLKLVELLLKDNPSNQIYATCRNPPNAKQLTLLSEEFHNRLIIEPLDVTKEETITNFVQKYANLKFQLVINNAGQYSPNRQETILNTNSKDLMDTYRTNCIGPILMIQNLYNNNLFDLNNSLVVNISSGMGSISRTNRPRRKVSYCCSKAALNMFTKMISIELEGIHAFAVHPGWVATDMGTDAAPLTTDESCSGILNLIKNFNPKEHNGKFLQYDGKELEW
ncbi:hypothetical protein ABK040_014876 [Willaertia magna]